MVRRKCGASPGLCSFLEVSKGSTKVAQILIFLRRSVFCFQGRYSRNYLFCQNLSLQLHKIIKLSTCENQPDLHCCNNQLGYDLQRADLLSSLTCFRMWISMCHGCKMLNHGLYKNLFPHFISIFKKQICLFFNSGIWFSFTKVSSVAMTGMSFKVLVLLNIYSLCAVNEVKLGNKIYQFILRFELMMWECWAFPYIYSVLILSFLIVLKWCNYS